jgi:predicted nucleic acid-binding protein
MHYLVDSDWTIDYLDGLSSAVQLLQPLFADGIAISIITYIEVYQGAYRRPGPAATQALAALLATTPVLPISLAVAERCARLRESLRRQGRRVNSRAMDLIIAATALEHDLTLVTRNVADYQDIPGLKLHL